jgi:hypothetical protein
MAGIKPPRPEAEMLGEVGRYHVRRIRKSKDEQVLDIREHVRATSFEGYTRRGIVLVIPGEVEKLKSLLDSVR